MKELNGKELAEYIKARQARQVRNLRQQHGIAPRLVILRTLETPVIDTYIRLKQRYGADILVDVDIQTVTDDTLLSAIDQANNDTVVHGIIVQLPLADTSYTDDALRAVAPTKDVDGLGGQSPHIPATALAIDWLVNGYNVTLRDKKIAVIGKGRLVGAPLAKLWQEQGLNVQVFDRSSSDALGDELPNYDIIVTAAGAPRLVTSQMVKQGGVVVDAATASENGELIGDVSDDVREREDVIITPKKGGVGPLTVCALFDNVIQAARSTIAE